MTSINRLFVLRKRLINYTREFNDNVSWKQIKTVDGNEIENPEYPNKKTLDENLATYEKLLQYQANVNTALAKANSSGPSEIIAKLGSAKILKAVYEGLEYNQSNFKPDDKVWDNQVWDRTVDPPVRGAFIRVITTPPSTTDFKEKFDKQCKIVRDLEDQLSEVSSIIDVEKFLDKETLDFLNSL